MVKKLTSIILAIIMIATFTVASFAEVFEEYCEAPYSNTTPAYDEQDYAVEEIRTFSAKIESEDVEEDEFLNGFYSSLIGIDEYMNTIEELEAEQKDVVVAVIDTGVDYNHPALAGRVDTVHDKDIYNIDDDAMDDNGHGTMVAGLIAEGTKDNVSILPIKVFGANGECFANYLVEGIRYAIDCDVDVINLSLGFDGPAYLLSSYIQEAIDAGISVVVSAGNDGVDCENHTPANVSAAITVGASTSANKLFSFSNYGERVDIVAPGRAYCAVAGSDTYQYAQGTSLSAGIISACAANLKAYDKSLCCKDIELIMRNFAIRIPNESRITNTGIISMFDMLKRECLEMYETEAGYLQNEVFELKYVCFPESDVTVSSEAGLWEYTGTGNQMRWLSNEGTHTLTFATASNSRAVTVKSLSECEHIWEYIIVTTATCKYVGEYYMHCTKCGKNSEHIFGDKLGDHKYGKWQAGSTPTCAVAGSRSRTCVYCSVTTTEPIPALGHDYVDHAGKAATCTESGWKAYQTCSRCNYSSFEAIPSKGGHTLGVIVTSEAPTCTAQGRTEGYGCTQCGMVITASEKIPASGHTYVWKVEKHPTCTESGLTVGRCFCGAESTITTPATGHSYNWTTTKEPTCTTAGSMTGRCNCGDTAKKTIAKTGHTDADNNGVCDTCGNNLNEEISGNGIVSAGFLQSLMNFFQTIASFFRNLFK